MLVFITPTLESDRPPPYSYRARATIPSSKINDSIVTDDITSLKPGDVAVLGKKHTKEDAEYCISNKIKYIVDIADDKFKNFKHWYFTIPKASAVTTTCYTLKDLIKQETKTDSIVIPDPTERSKGKPRFNPIREANAFYYGSDGNYSKLQWQTIKKDLDKVMKTHVKIMTNIPQGEPKMWKIGKKIPGYFNLDAQQKKIIDKQVIEQHKTLIPWEFHEQAKLVEESDFVLLPVVSDRHSSCKGNNRPIDALQQGRMVLTTPGIPSYHDLEKFLYIGDLGKKFQQMLDNPEEVIKKIEKAQKFIERTYSPKAVANKWEEVYKKV